ncbi:tyrosine-type recombinase/integrase [Microbacterium memoriense]|uniref:Site-specific integrase n=1 Tax=Microbacterium memoriense TaxID=2978350 RepID=A0ABT2P7W0_9MICO|nr:site-specific integrase [Microbacterium memoriense]MCT9000796.1 site-specific integrase [Microbacterium memoriense]
MAAQSKRKRRETFGQVEKLPSGRIRARYLGPDGERHNAPATFSTLTDARAYLARVQDQIARGAWLSAVDAAAAEAERQQTLGTYAEKWITERTNSRGERLRPATVHEYRRLLAGPLAPLTSRHLSGISPAAVRTWRTGLLDTGKMTQASRAYGLLNAIMSTAADDRLISENPCTIKGGQSTHTGRKVLPPADAELDTILETITPRFRALVLLAAWGGLRYGEATELRRRDLTITRNDAGEIVLIRVRVERGVTHTTAGGFQVGPPKSEAGIRTVALPPHVHGEIVGHLEEHTGRFPDSLLFPAADGSSHLAQSTFTKHWYPARRAAGRDDMPFHALRHYGGTAYAQTGATLKEIQARLGHSSAGAAMRYQHTTDRDDELAARMARRV